MQTLSLGCSFILLSIFSYLHFYPLAEFDNTDAFIQYYKAEKRVKIQLSNKFS